MDKDLFARFTRESEKLRQIKKEEDEAYSTFCKLRSELECQQEEVNHLFDRMMRLNELS